MRENCMKKVVEGRHPKFLEQLKSVFSVKHKDSSINVIVDLSHWNQNVNFKLAKEDGIIGVIHKATQGLKYVDPKYAERRKKAEDLGPLWGAYHFGIGKNGRDQADHFLDTVGKTKSTILALDIEENRNGKNITPKQAEDFIDRILPHQF